MVLTVLELEEETANGVSERLTIDGSIDDTATPFRNDDYNQRASFKQRSVEIHLVVGGHLCMVIFNTQGNASFWSWLAGLDLPLVSESAT
ncbi:hypothetical protein ACQQ2Q_03125 [Agrobacterium sp. ES01]|uniref:hypothetical protein n=1 Tax=Agrobacterium sp. ES01 TaxID=3420714 RepID=UPI003D11F720